MREIKFRFWHKNDKCYFSPSSLGWKFDPVNGQLYVNGLNVTDRVEIMQYTGLKDKNGKEIYEGDILDCTCESLTNFGQTRTGKFTTTYYEILWTGEAWGKKVLKSELLVVGKVSDGVEISAKYSVVCGNIHNNPELLK